jgi:hypothetical protein
MPRKIVSALACATVASSLVIGGTATAAPTTVVGKVGPGYSISLTLGGKKVKKLKAGVKYRFVTRTSAWGGAAPSAHHHPATWALSVYSRSLLPSAAYSSTANEAEPAGLTLSAVVTRTGSDAATS